MTCNFCGQTSPNVFEVDDGYSLSFACESCLVDQEVKKYFQEKAEKVVYGDPEGND